MDLPIDHFRLLGVSPASDAQAVLRTLSQRLDRVPDQGFTTETLHARARLLQESADLLSDPSRRVVYEAELLSLGEGDAAVPALEISSSLEVAGLLLLLEAGQPQEAFDLASRGLQPPQAPALGSGREADLSLLAGLSCLAAAEEARSSRLFEAAARLLQQGLQLLQRMGQVPELRQRLSRELDRLTPYLVLDLLSRDLAAQDKRSEGLALLEQLVQRRGGLEGEADPEFNSADFQSFVRQIRGFLTVQEQLDLFSRWGDAGSEAADFLATITLVASGFTQRKPERIAAARERLLASGRGGIEPLLANLHLLLGDVDGALACFDLGASEELRDWAARQSDDTLGQLCAYCRDWLSRDVLPGFRDLDGEADLEAYFSDRDVVNWVEREDRRSSRGRASVGPIHAAGREAPFPGTSLSEAAAGFILQPQALSASRAAGGGQEMEGEDGPLPTGAADPEVLLPWPGLLHRHSLRSLAIGAGALAGVVLLALAVTTLQRPRPQTPPAGGEISLPVTPVSPPPVPAPRPASDSVSPSGSAGPADPLAPLMVAEPSEAQLRALLSSWLTVKSDVLRGAQPPPGLDRIAREGPVDRLRGERRADAAAGQTQTISVRIESVRIAERSATRIALRASLAYSDQRHAADGRVVATTSPRMLQNLYVFGRDGDRWRLAASHSAS